MTLIPGSFERFYYYFDEIDTNKRLCNHVCLSVPECMTKCVIVNRKQFENNVTNNPVV